MLRLSDDVFQIALVPRSGINAYLVGDVLVDAGTPRHGGRILSALVGHPVRSHVVTHAHIDHAGSTRRVTEALDIPVWAGAVDAADVESGRPPVPMSGVAGRVGERMGRFPAATVSRRLEAGDTVGPGFVVLDTPGHTRGHISLWREADRVLVCGDVVASMHLLTTAPGFQQPITRFTMDPAQNRASIRRIAELEPALVLPGHGPAVRDPAALTAFAASLPAD